MITNEHNTTAELTPRGAEVAAIATLEPAQLTEQGPQAREAFDSLVDHAAKAVNACRASARRAALDYVVAGRALREVKGWLLVPRVENVRMDNVSIRDEKGWVALCQERLGLSYKTADRYIDDAEAYDTLVSAATALPRAEEYLRSVQEGDIRATAALAALEQFKALPEKGAPEIAPERWAGLEAKLKTQAELVYFKEMERAALAGDEIAANELEQCAKGNIPMARAYSGWRGGVATKDKTRKDPDYARLVIKSATTVLNAWSKYYQMPIDARRAATDSIVAVMTTEDLPEEVGREIYAKLAARYGQPSANNRA